MRQTSKSQNVETSKAAGEKRMSNWDFGIEKEPPNRPRHLIVNHFLNSPFANLNFHRIWRSGDFVSW